MTRILKASAFGIAASLALLVGSASAQAPADRGVVVCDPPDDAGCAPYSPMNVDPAAPFGAVDINAAGNTPEQFQTFIAGVSGAQLIELIGRCSVVNPPTRIAYQGGYRPFQDDEPAVQQGAAGAPAAAGQAPAAGQAGGGAQGGGVAAITYQQPATDFCRNLNIAVYGAGAMAANP